MPEISGPGKGVKSEHGEEHDGGGGEEHAQMHHNGDGTFHVEVHGEHSDHPDMGHALMHVAHHFKPEGKHFHAHHDGMSVHSHGISEGEHDGPHDHADAAEASDHMMNYLDEGGAQSGGEGDQEYDRGDEEHSLSGWNG